MGAAPAFGKMRERPELRDASRATSKRAASQTSIKIDRDTASRLGVTPQAIDDTLYDAFGQRQVSVIYTQLNQYRVILEVKPEFQKNPDALSRIYVKAVSGAQIPLSAFTSFEQTATPLAISQQGTISVGDLVVQPRAGRRAR